MIVWLGAVRAHAQEPAPQPLDGPSGHADFLTRYDFTLSAAPLLIDDRRFSWDTHFGGAVDLLDYGVGRFSVLGDYEAVLGREIRRFDPNQAYYTLEMSSSVWAAGTEFGAVFRHVSRHLSDRPKRLAIAWNVLQARAMRRVTYEGFTFAGRADVGWVTERALLDYQWTADADLVVRRPLNQRFSALAHGTVELYGVDPAVYNRGTQKGYRIEGGVRIDGRAGALEFFAGYERRFDADPLALTPEQWPLVGFRLVNK